jgi:hypothetical protein
MITIPTRWSRQQQSKVQKINESYTVECYTPSYTATFDSDSIPIRVDNCSSRTISGYKTDFVETTLQDVTTSMTITGFGNTQTSITHIGTIRWTILDDDGIQRTIYIPNSFYVPESHIRLLSPQHWAQEINDNAPNMNGTWCATYFNKIILHWHPETITKTIPIDRSGSNTGILWTIPNNSKYTTFYQKFREKLLHLQTSPSTYNADSTFGVNIPVAYPQIRQLIPTTETDATHTS